MRTTYQIAELTPLTAGLQRPVAGLRADPVNQGCNDTCGCVTDPEASSGSTRTAVPLLVEPDAPSAVSGACGDLGRGCGSGGASDAEPAIACTLDARRMGTRVEEWSALLDTKEDMHSGVVARTAIEGGVRLQFGPDADVTEVARLAAAEQECCRFFSFALLIDAHGVALDVRAPAEAIDIVTALFGAPA